MPIYEYTCRQCGAEFEKLVQGQAAVACPACQSGRVSRHLSLVGIRTAGAATGGSVASPQGGCCGGCGCH